MSSRLVTIPTGFVTPVNLTASQTSFLRLKDTLNVGEDWACLVTKMDGDFNVNSYLLSVYRNIQLVETDRNYYAEGGDDNIQGKSVQKDDYLGSLIPEPPSGGTIKSTGGTPSTSGNLAVQSDSGGGGNLYIRNSTTDFLTLHSGGKITNKANDSTSQNWSPNLRNACLIFDSTSTDSAIGKISGTNSSGQAYNRFQIFCGTNNTSTNAGIKNAMLSLINTNGT